MERFSKRHGYGKTAKEILTREDAPEALRYYAIQAYYEIGKNPSDAREVVCSVLRVPPDGDNWTQRPNVYNEVKHLMDNCEWYKVYDIAEVLALQLNVTDYPKFETALNELFIDEGIGWKMEDRQILYRGDEEFESVVATAERNLEAANLQTAKGEIKEAIRDISRRPEPDITGAVQHSLGGLECVAREITGDRKTTLGKLIAYNTGIFPAPLGQVVSMMYGFASEKGRHLKEGEEPNFEEAELLVGLSASLASYLAKKIIPPTTIDAVIDDDLPF